jgi:Fe-S-cluster containining protein
LNPFGVRLRLPELIVAVANWICHDPGMKQVLTDTLCTQCGLCCDGTLFADVELKDQAEADGLEAMGLEIEEEETGAPLLVQPCAALRGRRCGIYGQRPECCRTFECRLLRNVRGGVASLESAVAIVAETHGKIRELRRLAAELGQGEAGLTFRESCEEALEVGARSDRGLESKRRALEQGLAAVELLIGTQFLGRGDSI